MNDAVAAAISHHNPVIAIILALTYAGVAVGYIPGLKTNRAGIALLGGIAMMVFGGVTTTEAVSYVSWPTVFLLFGFFVISAQLRLSGFYGEVAGAIAARLGHPGRFLFVLMLATGALSAFLNHDVVCYVFTPIVGMALLRKRVNPVPFLIALAISSNIGAAATLVGNAQDMVIGEAAHLNFGHYMLWSSGPVIFAMGAAFVLIWMLCRNRLQSDVASPVDLGAGSRPPDRAHTIKGLVILALVIVFLFSPVSKEITALVAAGIHLASPKFYTDELLGLVEWPILILFMGLFVVTGAFQSTGYGEQGAAWLAGHGLHLDSPVNLAVTTAVLSNLINNSPTVMLLIKVIPLSPPTLAYVLALANSFGGSLLISGSVANIIVVKQARTMGIHVSFWDFARLGIPVTLVALAGLLGWVALVS